MWYINTKYLGGIFTKFKKWKQHCENNFIAVSLTEKNNCFPISYLDFESEICSVVSDFLWPHGL